MQKQPGDKTSFLIIALLVSIISNLALLAAPAPKAAPCVSESSEEHGPPMREEEEERQEVRDEL